MNRKKAEGDTLTVEVRQAGPSLDPIPCPSDPLLALHRHSRGGQVRALALEGGSLEEGLWTPGVKSPHSHRSCGQPCRRKRVGTKLVPG